MKNKMHSKLRMAPLQFCEVIPMTDPAEIAELERKIREAEKVMVDGYARLKKPRTRKKKPQKS